jgi:4-hydroxy-4-methyl-2-oxoglutarate aldolase
VTDDIRDQFTTAILSDSLDLVGLRHQVLDSRLRGLVPGSRALGRARTATFEPTGIVDPVHPYDDAIDFIDSANAGDLFVLATAGSNESAVWGELFSAAAIGRGAVGMLTDGNVRDVDRIAVLGFAAFARSARPIDFRGRMTLAARQRPVTIGGVVISPGDLVLADDDGIVVVPQAAETEVIAAATRRVNAESVVLAELLAGSTLRAVWDKHRIL